MTFNNRNFLESLIRFLNRPNTEAWVSMRGGYIYEVGTTHNMFYQISIHSKNTVHREKRGIFQGFYLKKL